LDNLILSGRTKNDIEKQVAKVLRNLGDPEPPLRLEEVRAVLRLDRAYYSYQDTGVISETIHRLKVAGKQILARPTILLEVIGKLSLKALWVPDRKRILIDSELPVIKQRWAEAHEIGHGLIPWHEVMLHGDHLQTLSLACQHNLEAEANFAAGRLLFMQGQFDDRLLASPLSIDHLRRLAKEFGNSVTSTLWRAVEGLGVPCVGLVSIHPLHERSAEAETVRYLIRSARFASEFTSVCESELFSLLRTYCRRGNGPLGAAEIVLTDSNGEEHVFLFETFFNRHEALTLGIHQGAWNPHSLVVSA
jgi:hypothetical protein